MSNPKNLSLSDANQALQDVAEAVNELKAECYRLRAELKTSNAERDEARREVCDNGHRTLRQAYAEAIKRGWDCFPD